MTIHDELKTAIIEHARVLRVWPSGASPEFSIVSRGEQWRASIKVGSWTRSCDEKSIEGAMEALHSVLAEELSNHLKACNEVVGKYAPEILQAKGMEKSADGESTPLSKASARSKKKS